MARTLLALSMALAALVAVTPAEAKLYKCKAPGGKIIYSDEPCEKVGGRKEKSFSKAELKGNQMRMRPRPSQGDGEGAEFGSGSNFQGAAPKGGAGDPRQSSD